MQEKNRLKELVKDMPDKDALDFLDKYKDARRKPKPGVPGNIGSIINRGNWKKPETRNTHRSKEQDEANS